MEGAGTNLPAPTSEAAWPSPEEKAPESLAPNVSQDSGKKPSNESTDKNLDKATDEPPMNSVSKNASGTAETEAGEELGNEPLQIRGRQSNSQPLFKSTPSTKHSSPRQRVDDPDMTIEELLSDFSAPIDKQTFKSIITQQPRHQRPIQLKTRSMTQEIFLSKTQISSIADDALNGKPLKITDPNAVAEVIDELNVRRVEALHKNDYKLGKALKTAIDSLRTQFRLKDRDNHHSEVVSKLKALYQDAVDSSSDHKEEWKQKVKSLEAKHKEDFETIRKKHIEEQEKLDGFWLDPNNTRFFSHKSGALLQGHAIEHYLLLTERYDAADQQRKLNLQREKKEICEQQKNLMSAYEMAKSQLLLQQYSAVEKMKMEQEQEMKFLNESESEEFEVKQRRVEATEFALKDEDYHNFVARKYHNFPDKVVPVTVSTASGGNDLPPMSKGNISPPGFGGLMKIRRSCGSQPLQLPPPQLKRPRLKNNSRDGKA